MHFNVVAENPHRSFAPEIQEQLIKLKLIVVKVCLLLALALPATAQITEESANENTAAEVEEEEAVAADTDGSLDDAANSIDVRDELDGVGLSADVRVGYFESEIDERDATSQTTDFFGSRWRFRTEVDLSRYLRTVGRIAGICSSNECSPNLVLEDSIPTTNGMTDGDITIDEAYLHWFRLDRFDLAVGRMQTKFVARGGVFAKSLDRNDSNNIHVNWTDWLGTSS
jgi:hypothetical protein